MKLYFKGIVLFLAFCFLSVAACAQTATKQSAQASSARKPYQSSKDWQKDVDKNIEAAIKILGVIQEELKKADFTSVPPAPKFDGNEEAKEELRNWSAAIRKFYAAARRAWRKIRKALPEDQQAALSGQAAAVSQSADQAKDWSKDVSSKLQETIEFMEIIKEEIDKGAEGSEDQ